VYREPALSGRTNSRAAYGVAFLSAVAAVVSAERFEAEPFDDLGSRARRG